MVFYLESSGVESFFDLDFLLSGKQNIMHTLNMRLVHVIVSTGL